MKKGVESAVLAALRSSAEDGAYQSDLVRSTGFSRSRVSEVLSCLEKDRRIRRTHVGKNWKVFLHSEVHVRENEGARNSKALLLGMTRAAEYPFVIPFKRLLKEASITLDIRVYDNGVDVMRDLSSFRLDLGIAPLLTQFMFYSLGAPIRIVAPAGSGGSSIMVDESVQMGKVTRTGFSVASTKLSTMELLLRASLNEGMLPDAVVETVYASSPAEISKMITSKRADAACIWEPYATMLERQGFKRLVRYTDLGEHICCVMAVGNHLQGYRSLNRLAEAYTKSMEEFTRNPDLYLSPYSILVGYDSALLTHVAHEYTYPGELDLRMVTEQLDRAGVRVPSPASIEDALLRF